MSEIWNRLKAKTPKLFKNIRNIGLTISAISVTILGAGIAIPDSLGALISLIGAIAGAVAAGVAQLTVIWGVDEQGKVIESYADTIVPDDRPNPPKKEEPEDD